MALKGSQINVKQPATIGHGDAQESLVYGTPWAAIPLADGVPQMAQTKQLFTVAGRGKRFTYLQAVKVANEIYRRTGVVVCIEFAR
jgi:hypothetical protein